MSIGNGCRSIVKMWDDADYRRIARIAIPIGLAACACIVAYDISSKFYVIGVFMAFVVLATPWLAGPSTANIRPPTL